MKDHSRQDSEAGRRHHPEHHHHEEHHGGRGGGHRGRHGGGHQGGHGDQSGARGRAQRGEARYVLLDALRDGPKHGYEIIKSLEERSAGEYVPSPGTVYPTMQLLEDLGQVRSDQNAERRVYSLTEAGHAELEARAEDLNAFWTRFGAAATPAASQPEIGFLQEEIDQLARTIWNGLRGRDDAATIRSVRAAVERCRGEVREIIAAPTEVQPKEA